MTAITSASSMKVPSDSPPPKVLEFQIAMLQLSAALLSEAPVSMQKDMLLAAPHCPEF